MTPAQIQAFTIITKALERIAQGDFKHAAHAQNIAIKAIREANKLLEEGS